MPSDNDNDNDNDNDDEKNVAGSNAKREPLVSFEAVPAADDHNDSCPFGNDVVSFELTEGSCVWLRGASGAGKTTLAGCLVDGVAAGDGSLRRRRGVDVRRSEWRSDLSPRERCGALFQRTTLLDALTVAGNVRAALAHADRRRDVDPEAETKRLLEAVGLDHARDGPRRATELSGGMARRASLALQLAQNKRVIVLDEPFAGLDRDAATGVARELRRLRRRAGAALLLISHEPDLARIVTGTDDDEDDDDNDVTVVTLTPPKPSSSSSKVPRKADLYGVTGWQRFSAKLADYLFHSLPLVLLTFVACGLAIAMLSSDMLRRVDVTRPVLDVIDAEVRPLLRLVTGEERVNPLHLVGIKMKVRSMLDSVVPDLKAKLYAVGMAKLFVLEIGPLVTALLLAGRIGGSHAGEVATMEATDQNRLLRVLGASPTRWTTWPAVAAATLASPALTVAGTVTALWLGGKVGPGAYGVGDEESYFRDARETTFPPLRLRALYGGADGAEKEDDGPLVVRWLRTTHGGDGLVEIATWPPAYHLLKSLAYVFIIMAVAESSVRLHGGGAAGELTPRKVPRVITTSVVAASLLIIVADWGFSQLLLLRR